MLFKEIRDNFELPMKRDESLRKISKDSWEVNRDDGSQRHELDGVEEEPSRLKRVSHTETEQS